MKNIFAALLLGLSGILYAQNSISGTVTDNQNRPMPSVSVYVPESQKSTLTDADGRYTLANVPTGPIKIIFSYVGFATVEMTAARNQTTLDIVMT